jgi:Cyclic nucleotide-binding domain
VNLNQSDSVDVIRRLVALKRMPLLAGLGPSVLVGLAEHGRDRPFRAGAAMPLRTTHVHFLSARADCSCFAPGERGFAAYAPDLVPCLAGMGVDGEIRSRADGIVIEIAVSHLFAALEDDFSLYLAIARALADEAIRAAQSLRPGAVLMGRRSEIDIAGPPSSLDLVARVLHLRSALPFAHTRVGSLVQLARYAAELRATDGLVLWREGDRADNAVILLDGCVRAHIGGGEAFTLRPGSMLGGADALARRPRWFTAVADGPVLALSLPMERFLDTLEDQPGLAREVLRAFARALVATWTKPDATVDPAPPDADINT